MADKKKMSVAEILAAARKMDSAGEPAAAQASHSQEPASAASQQKAAPSSQEQEKGAAAKPAKASPPAPKKPQKDGSGGRPSVADILAMARAEKQAAPAEKKEATKPAAKAAPAKPAPAKTAAAASGKAAPKPAAKAPSSPATGAARGPLDTASILAAARKADKAGPMSKAEAARLKSPKAPAPAAKKKAEVPPMPVKPAYAKRPAPAPKPARSAAPQEQDRRGFLILGFAGLAGVGVMWLLATARFMYPNVLREPPSRFKVGFPGDFAPGTVETKFKAQYGIWVVSTEYNGEPQLFALKSVCTHLGCTPNWLEAEQKFKCPCHGSGFYKDGINFEGPAPRPLERYAIAVADDGQVEIDKSRTFQEEMGAWSDPASFIPA